MSVLIAVIILFLGLTGMGIIMFRKIPVLAELPEVAGGFNIKAKILQVKEKIKFSKYFKLPPSEFILQKILSKVRVLTLKIETKTAGLLQKLREKSQKKKENEQYWQKLKKSINEEKPSDNQNNDSPR